MSSRLYILAFHRILPNGKYFIPPMFLSEEVFAKLIKRLARRFCIMSLSDAVQTILYKKKHIIVALTFDDGYLDNFERARPLLLQYSLPAFLCRRLLDMEEE